jgi:hypothetical protein
MDRREELRKKLRQKINEKKQKQPTRQEIQRIKKDINREYRQVTQDERVTSEMIDLFSQAMKDFPNLNMPNPKIVLDNDAKYKEEYGKYVLNIMQKAREENWNVDIVKSMLNNSYTKYMTHMLNLPELPTFIQ